jgi:LmbE family N-acetylglucosaminyl deacetylase
MFCRTACLLLLLTLPACFLHAQLPRPLPPGEILLNLKKLNVLGSALYVAAHPDDENTVMLSWLAKERLVRTGYLSVTRGDGGQNLIGPEQAELMGLIRTYELLAARAIDGPEQYFTRAADFGFSKNTAETMQIWDKNAVMSDVVFRIRQFRPDVLVCRFPPDPRAGHGNHSASAVLAEEAFKLAGDPTKFPEQLKYVEPWQPKRVVWNTFAFGAASAQRPAEGTWIPIEIGGYNALLGKSYPEIAAESRSQHKSQGFGVPKSRGNRGEYLVHKVGELAQRDLFDGLDLTWNRVPGGAAIQPVIDEAIRTFRPDNPAASIPLLVRAYRLVDGLADVQWKAQKKQEIQDLLVACAGLWYEANPSEYAAAGGESLRITASLIKRAEVPLTLDRVKLTGLGVDTTLRLAPGDNELVRLPFSVTIPRNQPLTHPYWLAQPRLSKGMYRVDDPLLIGLPEKPADLQAEFSVTLDGLPLTLRVPVVYKYTDEIRGELYRPFEIRPVVTATLADKVVVFPDNQSRSITLTLKASKAEATGNVSLTVPAGWRVEPARIPFTIASKFGEQTMTFRVFPSTGASEASLRAVVSTPEGTSDRGLLSINYEHIPPLNLFPTAEARLVRLDIRTKGRNIGYIAGAGDEVPAALRQIGYAVTNLTEKELNADLSGYDAIVVGVRAYNTNDRLRYYNPRLFEYVKAGGTMVVQYQVNSFLQQADGVGPFPFHISRDRVTVEEAPITLLKPEHPALTTPNKITAKDFNGWVQERSLYVPDQWDAAYTPLLRSNDPGEAPQDGGLLVAPLGKGYYVFTGYAFFRQLPAGVPGAYRLFANLISLGK